MSKIYLNILPALSLVLLFSINKTYGFLRPNAVTTVRSQSLVFMLKHHPRSGTVHNCKHRADSSDENRMISSVSNPNQLITKNDMENINKNESKVIALIKVLDFGRVILTSDVFSFFLASVQYWCNISFMYELYTLTDDDKANLIGWGFIFDGIVYTAAFAVLLNTGYVSKSNEGKEFIADVYDGSKVNKDHHNIDINYYFFQFTFTHILLWDILFNPTYADRYFVSGIGLLGILLSAFAKSLTKNNKKNITENLFKDVRDFFLDPTPYWSNNIMYFSQLVFLVNGIVSLYFNV